MQTLSATRVTITYVRCSELVAMVKERCKLCGKPASFTLRNTNEIERELVTGADVYMLVCRHYYVGGQVDEYAAELFFKHARISVILVLRRHNPFLSIKSFAFGLTVKLRFGERTICRIPYIILQVMWFYLKYDFSPKYWVYDSLVFSSRT